MGTAFLYGNGGGSNLNFKVVGGTSGPASPVENTVWVVTDAAISKWDFRAEGNPSWAEPEGTVFITSSTDPVNIHFNAIKNATKGIRIFLQLLGCIQYSAGAWRKREAYIYQGGVWKQFSNVALYLYNNGDQCTNVSGGWDAYAYKRSDDTAVTEVAPTVAKNSSSITVTHYSSWENYTSGALLTNASIDVTNYGSLSINVTAVTLSDASEGLKLFLTNTKSNNLTIIASLDLTATGIKTLNISSVSGACYVGIYCQGTNSPASVTFNQVYLS